jgi:hypothetical protein
MRTVPAALLVSSALLLCLSSGAGADTSTGNSGSRDLLTAAGATSIGAYDAQVSPLPPVGRRLTKLRIKRRSRKAFRVSYRLDAADGVSFELMRARPGRRRAGQGCLAPRRARPSARRCTRWVTVRSFSRPGEKGSNSLRMRARGLQRGRHMLKATPGGGSAVFRRFRVKAFRP